MKKNYQSKVFKGPEEYIDFAIANQVYGSDAIKLKIQLTKHNIPLPIIRKKIYTKYKGGENKNMATYEKSKAGKKSTSKLQTHIAREGGYKPMTKMLHSKDVVHRSHHGSSDSYPVHGLKGRKGAANSTIKNHA